MGDAFCCGDPVEWSSQTGGKVRTKRGVVVAVVPARMLPTGLQRWPELQRAHSLTRCEGAAGLTPNYRGHVSYLVSVPNRKTRDSRTRPFLYWPRVQHLRLVASARTGAGTAAREGGG